ncbi:lysophospholipid acyltransferase family protein [Stappia sp. ES.058]|uniref:lysophospholipid acyltransferase family protein n=1 Tax=Stappia sp. ES.058 TaxID=1881061 RepID=UPI00087C0186|nr:lysophospholipid acyltransferase family protein [Stappia sp. ES.058]SDU24030.1 1-acyl-sn-glycerol-3-phosphate acyltransferases [Stappia sp. ES.058]
MTRALQLLFFVLVRVVVTFVLGLNVRRRELLPTSGPAILVANHNSHLDTLVMMSLLPLKQLTSLRPVAAADYFLKTRAMAWFSLNILRIIPIERSGGARREDPLAACHEALKRHEILILFPEGSRGAPEEMTGLKKGIAHLAEKNPNVPVTPVFTHGLGKSLPKGSFLLVPFFCDIFVGEPISWPGSRDAFMTTLAARFAELSTEKDFAPWE